MKKIFVASLLTAVCLSAQNLTPAQKEADFRYLASLYSTYYAPLDWKKQLFGFDALKINPWLDRVAKTQNDLDFYEVCVEYVAGLNDTHTYFDIPSDFVARTGFSVDLYDGKLLIDSISRTLLPARDYPFAIGDELVSVDGVDALQLLETFVKYETQGNVRAARRLAAARLTIRPQAVMPHASEVGAKATVVIRRQNGASETYTMDWSKTGTPLEVGPVPSPKTTSSKRKTPLAVASSAEPDYMAPLNELRYSGVNPERNGLVGYGSRNPVFVSGLPSTFTRRLGSRTTDFFYSGTFKWFELTIGFIRIPSYSPPSTATAVQQFEAEIAYMNANTDGLIIDEMRNPGGNLCFGEAIAQRLIPYPFHVTGFEVKPYWIRVIQFYNAMVSAKTANASPEIIQQYENNYNEMLAANREGRTVTNPIPLCSSTLDVQPAKDANGNVTAYTKPIILLIDEFSTSTADSVAGMLQDSGRAVTYGYRTNGAGGNNTNYDAGTYSESVTGMTLALQSRKNWVGTADYPTTRYIENVGVPAEIVNDYMTKDNLLRNGAGFIDSFLQSMAAYIRARR